MKVTELVAPAAAASKAPAAFGQNEDAQARKDRMKEFWQDPMNAVLHPIGQLLSSKQEGKTLAQLLEAGEILEFESVMSNGVALELPKGHSISMNNLPAWGCPACRSAHGSGVYPSRKFIAKKLAANRFFYRPTDKALFVISQGCWQTYVKKLGANTAARFVDAGIKTAPKVTAPVAAKK